MTALIPVGQSVANVMPSGTWNDFTDLPAEFLSQFGVRSHGLRAPNCFYSMTFIYFASTMDDLLLAACVMATMFNLIVIVCSVRLFREKGDTLHLFILNMTIGDVILTLFCHPYELVTRRHVPAKYHTLTVFLNFANWVGLAVSGLSLTLLNVDKLIFFCWPFKYDTLMSYLRAKVFCISTWLVSIGFGTYYWVYNYLYFSSIKAGLEKEQSVFLKIFPKESKLSPISRTFYEVFTVIFCVIPIVSSLIVSCYLYQLTKRKRKLTLPNAHSAKIENKATSFAFIFATTLWTSCSLLPYRLTNLARIHVITWPSLDCNLKQTWSWLTWCMLYMLILNPIINPLITAFAYAPYRHIILSVFTKSPFFNVVPHFNKIFVWSAKQKDNEESRRAIEMARIFHIELPIRYHNYIKNDEPHPEAVKRAPLAKLPSICSCGSLETPNNIKTCTRF